MVYHNRKLFGPAFRPKPFCYDVRRTPNHSPEGTLSILSHASSASVREPVLTLVSQAQPAAVAPISFPINAATSVTFGGARYLHAFW